MPSFEEVLERFIEECHAGKSPSVSEYRRAYPQYAESMVELFPALLLLERSGRSGKKPAELVAKSPERIDHYRINRLIGRGGMGIVYEAYDESLHRTVALKVLRHFRGEEEQAIRRFRREAQTAAGLHHTNIVPVFGTGFCDGEFYYVMQVIPGLGIDRFLKLFEPKEKKPSEPDDLVLPTTQRWEEKAASGSHRSASADAATVLGSQTPLEIEPVEIPPLDSTPASEPDSGQKNVVLEERKREQNIVRSFLGGSYGDVVQYRKADAKEPACPELSALSFEAFERGELSFSRWCRSVCGVGIQIAQALDYAHRHDVLHRDIKPSNLLLDEGGVVWITDFGLARPASESDLTRSGQIVGTLRYMAPEALSGRFSPQSDLYSLALTLYEMLAFTPAFDESNYTKLIGQISEGRVAGPRKINRQIPRDLETILLKASEKEPDKRYRSGSEMADDLRRFLEERPIHARRISLLGRFWRWCRRNKPLAASVVTSAVLLVALALIMTVGFVQERSLRLDRELATNKATENLNEALLAFDDIFSTFGESTRSWNFVGGAGEFFLPLSAAPMSETDIKVLESLLAFYDRFAVQNAENESLQIETARAYANIGKIRQRMGNSAEALVAYKKSIDYYRRGFAISKDPMALELEEAQVVCRFLPLLIGASETDPLFDNILNLAIDAMAAVPPGAENADVRGRVLAKLLGFRGLTELSVGHNGRPRSLLSILFFDEGEKPPISPVTAERIDSDIAQAREISADLADRFPDDAILAAERNLTDGVLALRLALRGEKTASDALAGEMLAEAERLAAEHANSEMFAFHKIETELLAVCALRVDSDPADLPRQREILLKTLKTAERLRRDYAAVPGYLAFTVIVRQALAQVSTLLDDGTAAERYFAEADAGAEEFRDLFPGYSDLRRLELPALEVVEGLIASGRIKEAATRLERMRANASDDSIEGERIRHLTEQIQQKQKEESQKKTQSEK